MLNNYASFEIHSKELMNNECPEEALLLHIIQELKKVGIECCEPQKAAGTIYTICHIDNIKVQIEIFIFVDRTDSSAGSIIRCFNRFPLWKRFFISGEKVHSGKYLQYVIDQVNKTLSSDSRIFNIKW